MIKKLALIGGVSAALLAGGLGVGSASAGTVAPDQTASAAIMWRGDFCDNWYHRGDWRCRSNDRWNWDGHHWHHWRWDSRGHHWYAR
jgi:hypothetical protein